MNILFLSFYFEPDLCAGSFRNTSLFKELLEQLGQETVVDVVTTQPNRYDSYKVKADSVDRLNNQVTIHRIEIPEHGSGIIGQIKSFKKFYFDTLTLVKDKEYDLVYASSSRLFTAFLGAKIARKQKAKLYLDIRDIFRETITDIFKNKLLKLGLNTVLKPIERYTFGYADHINLVSEGFKSYFDQYETSYSFYTNGIDEIFLKDSQSEPLELNDQEVKTIVYGGNIGEGQGLDLVIPPLAEKFTGVFEFLIIGDGGAKTKLVEEITKRGLKNVKLIPPVSRKELIGYYESSHYLFLHLNKHKAFERVLPSKLFEYGTFNKPIIAGVGGYANVFLSEHLDNILLFEPTNFEELSEKLKTYKYKMVDRKVFKKKFSRKEINKQMAKSIISLLNG
ncbi:Glycosyltransferase WbuB [Tenacibaculum litopenaei]|uniref:glycosyltransferase family 4 protein n=1 Tax=Tenacibaculum litopenaei TaxID=396016 RepID=UPI0038952204